MIKAVTDRVFYAREHFKVFSSLNQAPDLRVLGKIHLK